MEDEEDSAPRPRATRACITCSRARANAPEIVRTSLLPAGVAAMEIAYGVNAACGAARHRRSACVSSSFPSRSSAIPY